MSSSALKILIVLGLAACSQEPQVRQNPIANVDAEDLGRIAHDWAKQTPDISLVDGCMNYWREAARDEIPQDFVAKCEAIAADYASTLSASGYGDVIADDVYLPPIWSHYLSLRQRATLLGSPQEQEEQRFRNKTYLCGSSTGREINNYSEEECELHLQEAERRSKQP